MQNFKIAFFVLLVITGGFASCRGKIKTAAGASGGVVFEVSDSIIVAGVADTLDFGRMREGEMVSREFRIRNMGNEPLVVINVESSCGCALFGFDREPVMPGGEKTITASFDSAGYYGEVIKTASLHTSLSQKPHTIIVEALVN